MEIDSKKVYECKKNIYRNHMDINDLKSSLIANGVEANSSDDNTLFINNFESSENKIDNAVASWYGSKVNFPIVLLYSLLPLTKQSCLLKI